MHKIVIRGSQNSVESISLLSADWLVVAEADRWHFSFSFFEAPSYSQRNQYAKFKRILPRVVSPSPQKSIILNIKNAGHSIPGLCPFSFRHPLSLSIIHLVICIMKDNTHPLKIDLAMRLVSSAENSTLEWKENYKYIEDIEDGRGYTAGIIGFCSGTGRGRVLGLSGRRFLCCGLLISEEKD